jgi:hypothetical protein
METPGDGLTPSKVPDSVDKGSQGMTIGDLLHEVIADQRKGIALVFLLTVLIALTLLGTLAFTRLFDVRTSEIQLGGTDSHVVFQSTEGRTNEYLLMISPQGWQKTGIEVHSGEHLVFTAGGKISLDVHYITDISQNRVVAENNEELIHKIRPNDSSETRAPEDYFTLEEKKAMILERPWATPDGYMLQGNLLPKYRDRARRYLLPGKGAGGLVAAINSGSSNVVNTDLERPRREEAFFVGSSSEMVAKKDGKLWFTVNDIQNADPDNPDLFYDDNIGSFWVKVIIRHKELF